MDRHRPLTPRLKEILELALRESQGLGHGWIGTEHLLLALSREPEGVASRVLSGLGVGQNEVRQEVMRALGVAREDGDGPRGAPDSP